MQDIDSKKIETGSAGGHIERVVTGPDGKPINHDLYEPPVLKYCGLSNEVTADPISPRALLNSIKESLCQPSRSYGKFDGK